MTTDPRLPTFLIIGAGKSGTTSLWSYLDQHPQIGMSAIKEPSFFSMDAVHARGLEWYRRLYAGCTQARARGEASNSYSALLTYPRTIDRIAAALTDPRIVYIVRHPRDRTESDWMQMSKTRAIGFHDFLRTDPVHSDKNRYLNCYTAYADRFGEDAVTVLLYDDLRRDPAGLLRTLCARLGVDPDFAFDTDTRHGESARGRRFVWGLGALRRTRLYADLSLRLPARLKAGLRAGLSQTLSVDRPVWTPGDIAWFRDRHEAQSTAFLTRIGRDPATWDWDAGWHTAATARPTGG